MTSETRSEMVIGGVLAAFVALLWWMNRRNGGGTGLGTVLPSMTAPLAGPEFGTLPAGPALSYTPGDATFNIGGPNLAGAVPGACNCPPSTNAAVFGSAGDMNAFLAGNLDFMQAVQNGFTNWN